MADKLQDPVEKKTETRKAAEAEDGVKGFTELTEADFKAVPVTAARGGHPFDGYPIKDKVKMGSMGKGTDKLFEVSKTFVVALHPQIFIFQDPSGNSVTVTDTKTKSEKIVTLNTYYSTTRIDYGKGKQNIDIVFDRKIPLMGGRFMENCAYVPSHYVRAQLMFLYDDKQSRIRPDNRFVFLDRDQRSRLLRLFQMIINPKIKVERLSMAISGDSQEAIEEIPA